LPPSENFEIPDFIFHSSFMKNEPHNTHEKSDQSKVDNENVQKRKREYGSTVEMTRTRLQGVAKQLGLSPNRTSFLEIKDRVLGPNKNRFPTPDRLALRYVDALVCWFCANPGWVEHATDPLPVSGFLVGAIEAGDRADPSVIADSVPDPDVLPTENLPVFDEWDSQDSHIFATNWADREIPLSSFWI
jgi:hypothetical protein